jgi:hypothetical protein
MGIVYALLDATVIVGLLTVAATAAGALVAWNHARRQALGLDLWFRDLRAWASEAIDVLSEAYYVWDKTKGIPASDESRLTFRLSALIERGRFLLSNIPKKRANEEDKPAAYQGLRNTALGPLVAAVIMIE